jgi:hypothetical protein
MLQDLQPAVTTAVSFRFEGHAKEVRRFIGSLPEGAFYTYVLVDPNGQPFYVGKGKGLRVLDHFLEAMRDSGIPKSNPFKCRKIQQIARDGRELLYRIDDVFLSHEELACLEREEFLIRTYRRRCDGGTLTNLAAGFGSTSARDSFSAERHKATLAGVSEERPLRTALNLFLHHLGGVDSVPIKPLDEYKGRLVAAYPSPKNLQKPSRRNGLTIAASAIASGLTLEPGVVVPRAFTYFPDREDWPLCVPPPDRVEAVIENGAMSDVLKLDLATLIPAPSPCDEALLLDERQLRRLTDLLGAEQLRIWGLLDTA